MFFDYNVYVACSLTYASQEFRDEVEVFKKSLRGICNVLCFYGLNKEISPYEIYRWDIHECVRKSDLVVAICDLPSTGLGYEIGTQIKARRMPCLAIAKEGALVTDLIIDTRQPGFEFRRYQNLLTDGLEMVALKLHKIHENEQRWRPALFAELSRVRSVA